MKRCVDLDIDISNEKFKKLREKYNMTSFINSVDLSLDCEEDLLSEKEINMCTAPDANRFRIYGEDIHREKIYYTGWIINRKIYTREELIKMNIELPQDGERFFLTSEGKPIEVKKGDEPAVCFFERIKKKIEEKKNKPETSEIAVTEKPKVVVIPEQQRVAYNLMNDHLFPVQTAITKAAGTTKPIKQELSPDLYIKVELKTNSANIDKNTGYTKVRGKNIASDFTTDEVFTYFSAENVIRARFFRYELTPDYDGNPHQRNKIYETGWIYNGEAYSLQMAYGMGLLSTSKIKEYMDSGVSRIVVTKCKFKFIMNKDDMTFDEYLEKCMKKEVSANKKD